MICWLVIGERGCYEDYVERVVAVAESAEQAAAFAQAARDAKETVLFSDGVFCRESRIWDDVRVEEREVGVLPEQSSEFRLKAASTDPETLAPLTAFLQKPGVLWPAPLVTKIEWPESELASPIRTEFAE